MRKWILVLIFSWAGGTLTGQDCKGFFPFEVGTVWEYAGFDDERRQEATVRRRLAIVDDTPDGGMQARLETVVLDGEEREMMNFAYEVTCIGDELRFDVISALAPRMTQAFANMDLTIAGDGLLLPVDVEPGESLRAARAEIQAESQGVKLINMTISVTDRKVEARESITTEAGNVYECLRIRYTLESRVLIAKTFEIVEWYAPGIGMIRSETYDRKGGLEGYSELKTFKRPEK